MNGIHDMGGLHGFGAVAVEHNEPVFHSRWEGRVYAMTQVLDTTGIYNLDEHRHEIEHGDETAEKALRFLIQKHADSKNLPVYVLRLGDLYADLAREYVATNDRPLAFNEDEFVSRTDRALDTYHKVATWDGVKEKPEGQSRFAALEAWKSATLSQYR